MEPARSHVQALGRGAMVLIVALAASCTLVHPLEGLRTEADGGAGSGGAGAGEPCAAGALVGVCGDGSKCTLSLPGQGITAGLECGPAGTVAAWTPCADDGECADGLWCEESSGVCKPWCVDAGICPDSAACVSARRVDGTAVTGWTVCTAHCRLDNPAARCAAGATCVLVQIDVGAGPVDEGDCAATGGKKSGCLCEVSADCAPALRCDPTDLRCHPWCDAGGLCAGGGDCGPALLTYDGTAFGQCAASMCFNN